MMNHNPQAVVQVNGRCSRAFAIERSVRQGCLLSPLLCDIEAVKKAVGEYERIAGAKVNFDKSEGLRLGAWRR